MPLATGLPEKEKLVKSDRGAGKLYKVMGYVIGLLTAGVARASEDLQGQLAATQRSNLIEMGIVIAVFIVVVWAAAWFMLREKR
jgi:hypothetical protein